MPLPLKFYELIDKYILNELNSEERKAFEEALLTNAELKKTYLRQKDLYEAVSAQGKENTEPEQSQGNLFSPDEIKQMAKKARRRSFFSTLMIAVSVSIITFITSLFIINQKRYKDKIAENTTYSILSEELEQLNERTTRIEDLHRDQIPNHVMSFAFAVNDGFITLLPDTAITDSIFILLNHTDTLEVRKTISPLGNGLSWLVATSDSLYDHIEFEAKLPQPGEEVYCIHFDSDNELMFEKGYIKSVSLKQSRIVTSFESWKTLYGAPVFNSNYELIGFLSYAQKGRDLEMIPITLKKQKTTSNIERIYKQLYQLSPASEIL